MKKPYLTIIVPTLNNEKYIGELLASIEKQTYTDFEVIFVDGESKDRTLEMISEFRSRLVNIDVKVVSQKPRGVSSAFNEGIRQSNGEYLIFMGTDDYFTDRYSLEKAFQILSSNKVDIMHGETVKQYKTVFTRPRFTKHAIASYILALTYRMPISHQNTFFSRDIFDKIGMYDENLKISMDLDFLITALKGRYKILLTNANFSVFRHRHDAVSKREGWRYPLLDIPRLTYKYGVVPFLSFPILYFKYAENLSFFSFDEAEYFEEGSHSLDNFNLPF
ncbi:glycosyltransferase [Candidatus Dojkabacteria bacterium]|nr:glycosyltransferase [Candidatus Dojkabacteria bacterium]